MPLTRRTVLAATAGLVLARPAFAEPGRIPFEHARGKVFAPVMVNGLPVQAMLDSGSAFYGLDKAFAAKAGVVPVGRSIAVRGVQHSLSGRWADIRQLSIGGVTLSGAPALVVDYGALAGVVGRDIEMALGGDFFRRFVVDLDFDDESLAIVPREGFTAPSDATLVALRPARGVMTAPVRFADETTLWAIVDTGSEPPLIVSPGPSRSLRLFDGRSSTAPLGGIGGGAVVKVGAAPTLSVGGHRFEDVPVQGAPRKLGAEANLGLGLLARFRLWLDFGGQRMWLRPRPAPPAFRRDLLGFYGLVRDDGIRITHVAPRSPAAAAGFRVGEVVTAINGMPAMAANLALSDAPAGTPLAITLADGTERALTLARYY